MHQSTTFLLSLVTAAVSAQAKICPLAGAVYPVPSQLGSSDTFTKASETFQDELSKAFDSESIYGPLGNDTTFSVEVYSLGEESLLSHHYNAPALPAAGVEEVDSDTVYRVGSISKLLTTYLYLINAGFESWNDPITKYVALKGGDNPIDSVAWDEVTVGALISHLSGMTRDGAMPPSADAKLAALGLPKVPGVEGNYCGDPSIQEFPCEDEGKDVLPQFSRLQLTF
jgi:hypothetical protein